MLTRKIAIGLLLYLLVGFIRSGICQIFINSVPVEDAAIDDTVHFYVNSIEVIGNKKTKAEVILRELRFEEQAGIVPSDYGSLQTDSGIGTFYPGEV